MMHLLGVFILLMRRNGNEWLKRLLLVFLFQFPFAVWAEQDITWLSLNRGINSYRDGQFEESVHYLQMALEQNREYPEAQYWLGKVYQAQGSSVLALEHYRNAIRYSRYLRNPEDEITILYAITDIMLQMGGEYQEQAVQILQDIIDGQSMEVAQSLELDYRYVNLIAQKGLDELVYLYRNELGASFEARKKLAELSWKNRDYKSALLHSTHVILSFLSQISAEYRRNYPEWRFDIDAIKNKENPDKDIRFPGLADGTSALLGLVYNSEPLLTEWLKDEAFWAYMYLLSISLYANGAEESARSIWLLIVFDINPENPDSESRRIESGQWARLSLRQLEEPFISVDSISP